MYFLATKLASTAMLVDGARAHSRQWACKIIVETLNLLVSCKCSSSSFNDSDAQVILQAAYVHVSCMRHQLRVFSKSHTHTHTHTHLPLLYYAYKCTG